MSIYDNNLDELWPFRPRPLEDESFASWFARTAWANGLDPSELYAVALPGARMFRIDLDRFACGELIENLSAHTGAPADDLWARTLQAWAGRLFDHDDGHNKLIWLPPAGTHQTSKSFGQQVCPRCLQEDAVPYLRQHWRFSFVTTCKTHGILLIDRCPSCAAPIQPLYTPVSAGAMYTCWKCGHDFREVVTQHEDNHAAQQTLLQIVDEGWGQLEGYGSVYALNYFRILWTIYRLLATGRFALPLREWIDDTEPPTGIPRIKEIERLNPRCRHALVIMALGLMQDWPHRFMTACVDVGISSRVLLKNSQQMPFALWEPITQYLSEPVGKITRSDIKNAKASLKAQDVRPTYRALQNLLGMHFHANRQLALPAYKHVPYGTDRYWKLDGISPQTRAAAKRMAKQEGENIGAWVDKTLRHALN